MTDWKSYLAAVDSQPQSDDVIEAVVDAFVAAKIKDPSSALGLTAEDVEAHLPQGNTAALALLRRAFVALDHAAAVQRAQELRAYLVWSHLALHYLGLLRLLHWRLQEDRYSSPESTSTFIVS